MSDTTNPPNVEDRPQPPWFIRTLWKIVYTIGITVAVIWLIASVALNFYARDALQQHLSQKLGDKVEIGGLRLGLSLEHPMVVATDVRVQKPRALLKAEALGIGVFLKGLDFDNHGENIKVFLGAKGLTANDQELGDYDLSFRFPQGKQFEIPEIKGKARGATLTGKLDEMTDGRWTAQATVEDVKYDLFAKGVTGGTARFTLDLKGVERRGEPVYASLSGHATMVGGPGKIEGNTLNLWAGSLLTNFLPGRDRDTHLNCAVADFDITNGIAKSRRVLIDTDKATITGTGTVDLNRQRMDMRFTPHTKGVAALSLATPMVVSGPFDNITEHPDPEGVIEKVGGIVLGTVAAPAALLPFLHMGGEGNACEKFLKQGKP